MNSGRRAAYNGYRFEMFVELALKEHGYGKSLNGKDLFKKRALLTTGKYYAKGVEVGTTTYGGQTKRKVDFSIVHQALFPDSLILECKWQQVRGSVEEKFPNLVNNIDFTGIPTIIVIGGGGYRSEALGWLKEQVNGTTLLAVWHMEEFHIAVNNGLFSTGFIKPAPPSPKVRKMATSLYERGLWE